VAVFLLNTPTLPSPVKGEGIQGRGKERGDVTSSDGGRKEVHGSSFLFFIQLFIGGE